MSTNPPKMLISAMVNSTVTEEKVFDMTSGRVMRSSDSQVILKEPDDKQFDISVISLNGQSAFIQFADKLVE